MLKAGKKYELEVIKIVDFGLFLDARNLGEVLLPSRYKKKHFKVGDLISVFLYFDSEDRLIASTQVPIAAVDEYAYLKVSDVSDFGAFLDWGLDKDLLVPFAEQYRPMKKGQSYLVYIYLNKFDGRIVASSKIDRFVNEGPHMFTPKQAVNLIIANTTDLGFKAIINHSHWGVLYKNDIYQRLSFGQSIKGFIKHIRSDGKIDLSLHDGNQNRDKNIQIIENYLRSENGFVAVHDKSDPELILRLFGMSKKAFKKAVGGLYKSNIIEIESNGIRLIEQEIK